MQCRKSNLCHLEHGRVAAVLHLAVQRFDVGVAQAGAEVGIVIHNLNMGCRAREGNGEFDGV